MSEADNNPPAKGSERSGSKSGDFEKAKPAPKDDLSKVKADTRKQELDGIHKNHLANVERAHLDHPTPDVKFHLMSEDEQRRWNEKSTAIAAHNRAYYLAVNAAVARHAAPSVEEATNDR